MSFIPFFVLYELFSLHFYTKNIFEFRGLKCSYCEISKILYHPIIIYIMKKHNIEKKIF